MKREGKTAFGVTARLTRSDVQTYDKQIVSPLYKKSEVRDNYKELVMRFRGDYDIIFRAYNEGIAYRFVAHSRGSLVVEDDQAVFNFADDMDAFVPYVQSEETYDAQFVNSFESDYTKTRISKWERGRPAFAPILFKSISGQSVVITEVVLIDYLGM